MPNDEIKIVGQEELDSQNQSQKSKTTDQKPASWTETLPQKELKSQQAQKIKLEEQIKSDETKQESGSKVSQPSSPAIQSKILKVSQSGLSRFQKPLVITAIAIFIVVVIAIILTSFLIFDGKLFKKNDSQSDQATPSPVVSVSPTPTNERVSSQILSAGKRTINWFVVTAPSKVPTNPVANWQDLNLGYFRIKLPKEWQVKTENINSQDKDIQILSTTKVLAADSNSDKALISLVVLGSELNLEQLVAKMVTNKNLIKSTIAAGAVSGIKLTSSNNQSNEEIIFLPLSSKKFLQITFNPQLNEDNIIFEYILSSLIIN